MKKHGTAQNKKNPDTEAPNLELLKHLNIPPLGFYKLELPPEGTYSEPEQISTLTSEPQ
jgi:hypothetical protein